MFTRTNSGLSNLARFHRVTKVVYVEGRGSDQRYWSTIFAAFGPEYKEVKFKSLGDCNAVDAMAHKICSGVIRDSIAVLDSDFKVALGSSRDNREVIYSFGYSYENDLFGNLLCKKLLSALSGGAASAECLTHFEAVTECGARRLRRIAVIEALCFLNHFPLVFQRNKSSGGVVFEPLGKNPVQFKSIQRLLCAARDRNHVATQKLSTSALTNFRSSPALRWVFGHLVKQYIFQMIVATATHAKGKKVTIDYTTFEDIAVALIETKPTLVDARIASYYRRVLLPALQ